MPRQLPAREIVDRSKRFGARRPNLARDNAKSVRHEKPTLPFWTWFIENPRGGGAM
jgi:hypothetical protein